ncbi:hypothetical protein CPC16_008450 [Podila verticillata]|nr:hypothetical protein CPC16_008450 [Podila verticillata]
MTVHSLRVRGRTTVAKQAQVDEEEENIGPEAAVMVSIQATATANTVPDGKIFLMPITRFLFQVAIEFNLKLIEQKLTPTQQATGLGWIQPRQTLPWSRILMGQLQSRKGPADPEGAPRASSVFCVLDLLALY